MPLSAEMTTRLGLHFKFFRARCTDRDMLDLGGFDRKRIPLTSNRTLLVIGGGSFESEDSNLQMICSTGIRFGAKA